MERLFFRFARRIAPSAEICEAAAMKFFRAALIFAALWLAGGVAAWGDSWLEWPDCEMLTERYHDGDSFYIRRAPRSIYIVRLYFVDTPETDDRIGGRLQEQADYFGIRPAEARRVGEEATEFVARALSRPFTVYTVKREAGGSSRKPRYFAFIECADGRFLAEKLVERGLARIYGARADRPDGVGDRRLLLRLKDLEKDARREARGAWRFARAAKEKAEPAGPLMAGRSARALRTTRLIDPENAARVLGLLRPGADVEIRSEPENGWVDVVIRSDRRIVFGRCRFVDLAVGE
jgi:endonuclease YncB( thermonuclease family)